jgi:hypothetical protein
MVKKHCTHSWLGSFAGRLIQLRPSMSIGSAVSYAVSSIHHAADIDPHRAAEIFVLANPMPEPVTQRRAARRVDSPAARYRALFGGLAAPTTAARTDRPALRATAALAR